MEFLKAYSSESESELGQEECDDSETLSSTERSESPVRDLNESAVRQVYLVTYTQADLKKFPTRRCFAEAVIRSFHGTNANVLHWVCCREVHKNGGYHYHMAIKPDRCKRWLPAKKYLKDEQDISVHFSNVHYNYYSAWKYVIKEDEEILESDNHPDLWNSKPPMTNAASCLKKTVSQKRERERSTDSGELNAMTIILLSRKAFRKRRRNREVRNERNGYLHLNCLKSSWKKVSKREQNCWHLQITKR